MKIGSILIALFITAAKTNAQELKTYEGPYNEGSARYTYYIKDGQRVLHGKFLYQHEQLVGNADANFKTFYTLQGTYENGKRAGDWIERDVNYNMKVKAVVWNKSVFDAHIMELGDPNSISWYDEIRKHYRNGLLDGAYKSYRQEHGQISRQVTANFKNGDFYTGHYSLVNQINYRVDGNFDDQGYFDGKWTLIDPTNVFEETRVYNHGVLLQCRKVNPQTGEALFKYDNGIFYSLSKLPATVKVDSVKSKSDDMHLTLELINSDETKEFDPLTGYTKNYTFGPTENTSSISSEIDRLIATSNQTNKNNAQQEQSNFQSSSNANDLKQKVRNLNQQKYDFERTHKNILHKTLKDVPMTLRNKPIAVRQQYVDDENKRIDTDPAINLQRDTLNSIVTKIQDIQSEIAKIESASKNENVNTQSSRTTISSKVFGIYHEMSPAKFLVINIDSIAQREDEYRSRISFMLYGSSVINGTNTQLAANINNENYSCNFDDDAGGNIQLYFSKGEIITGAYKSSDKTTAYDFLLLK